MKFLGKLKHTSDQDPSWVITIPALDIITQGYSKDEAIMMAKDAIMEYLLYYFSEQVSDDLQIAIQECDEQEVIVSTNEDKLLIALSLIKKREESGLSYRQIAKRLGSESPNTYARYEKGIHAISMEQYDKLLKALDPDKSLVINVI